MPLSPRRNHPLPHAGQELVRERRIVDGAREQERADHRAERDEGVRARLPSMSSRRAR